MLLFVGGATSASAAPPDNDQCTEQESTLDGDEMVSGNSGAQNTSGGTSSVTFSSSNIGGFTKGGEGGANGSTGSQRGDGSHIRSDGSSGSLPGAVIGGFVPAPHGISGSGWLLPALMIVVIGAVAGLAV